MGISSKWRVGRSDWAVVAWARIATEQGVAIASG